MTDPHMAEPRHTKTPKVSLEQLIQLKRSERPPTAFWEDFDRELHRRQLAALVAIEPWHVRAARALAVAARRLAPIGAGATAVAFAVIALVRMDNSRQEAVDPSEALAMAELDTRVVLLPEEAISVSEHPAQTLRATTGQEEFLGSVRSAPQELAAGLAVARRFVAVSAPVTFSSGGESSDIYSARALTAGTVLRSLSGAAPESL